MSHSWDCPSRSESERQARRDAESDFGYHGNRSSPRHFSECEESQRYYEDAYRSEMYHQEQRAEEERQERLASERRQEEQRMEEEAHYAAMESAREREYYEQLERERYDAHLAELADAQEVPCSTE